MPLRGARCKLGWRKPAEARVRASRIIVETPVEKMGSHEETDRHQETAPLHFSLSLGRVDGKSLNRTQHVGSIGKDQPS